MTDLVERSFQDGLQTLPMVMKNSGVVILDTMPKNSGDSKLFAERVTTDQYASVRDEGAVAEAGAVQYGYEKVAQVYTIAKTIGITKRMRVAGKDRAILDEITNLSEVCPNTQELDLSHRLTFAWSTSYNYKGSSRDLTTGDNRALIATNHTLTGSATTYSNQVTGNPAFSKGALEIAEKSFVEGSFDNLGVKIAVTPSVLITTDDPNTVNEVRQLLNATADVNSANSGTSNVYKSKYKHVVNPRIATDSNGGVDATKAKYWFLASERASDFYMCELETPYTELIKSNDSSENWNYLAAATYLISIVTGRWIR
ncbi:hypothetical protein EKK58_11665 [Candidatus Dependentiae bacterium]|nr:MAG: hypothetical protein EKK58_11665 [Candidatus Dependentiae bacterium]